MVAMIINMLYLYAAYCEESTLDSEGYLIWCGDNNADMNPYYRMLCRTIHVMLLMFPFFWFPDAFFRYGVIGVGFILWMMTLVYDSFGSRWCYSFFVADLIVLGKALLVGL
jgi:hypothetical protein